MRTALTFLVVAAMVVPAMGQATQPGPDGKEYKVTLDPPPYGLNKASFELWMPDTIGKGDKVRVVILNPLYQADTKIYERPDWRALAAAQKGVMIRHEMRTTVEGRPGRLPVGKDALDAIADALAKLGEQTGHPEMATAPLVITGLSQGGSQTTRLTALAPERVAAAVPFHGAALSAIPADSPARKVPMLIVLGSQDDLTARVMVDVPEALKGNPMWALLLQPGVPHQDLGDQEFILTWLDTMLKLRLNDADPTKLKPLAYGQGYSGQLSFNRRFLATDASVKAIRGAALVPPGGSWLPDKATADMWAAAVMTGYGKDFEAREEVGAKALPAPKDVKIDGKLDEWGSLPIDLVWPEQVLPSGTNWHGPADSQAHFAVAYDDKFVYFAVRVDDDQLVAEGKPPWNQDGVEFRIDARPAQQRMANTGRGEGETFLLVAVGPGPGKDQVFVNGMASLPKGTQVAGLMDDKGYSVEVALPAEYFDKAQGQPWSRFRLNVAVGDFDKEGKSQQWWRPDWRTDQVVCGAGTVEKAK